MKRALNALILLYPKPWRDRYQNEFEALLEDVPPTWRTLLDVLGGALKMQLKLWSPWKLVAACGIAGVIAAAAYTMTIPKRYVSRSILKYVDPAKLTSAKDKLLSRGALAQLIQEEDLYRGERMVRPLETVIVEMRNRDITIRPANRSNEDFSTAISFEGTNSARVQRITQRLTSMFVAENVGEVADPASLSVFPSSPRPSRNIVMGLVAGILAGALFALFNGLKVWRLAGALGLAGLALGAGVAYLVPERYSSMAIMRCSGPGCALIDRQFLAVMTPANLDALTARFALYPGETDIRRKLQRDLHFWAGRPGPGMSTIEFEYGDRLVAPKVVANVTSRLMDYAFREGALDPERLRPGWVIEWVEPASVPWQPTSPNRPAIASMGLFVGLLSAIGLGSFRNWRSPSAV